jgi:hypothetical protein
MHYNTTFANTNHLKNRITIRNGVVYVNGKETPVYKNNRGQIVIPVCDFKAHIDEMRFDNLHEALAIDYDTACKRFQEKELQNLQCDTSSQFCTCSCPSSPKSRSPDIAYVKHVFTPEKIVITSNSEIFVNKKKMRICKYYDKELAMNIPWIAHNGHTNTYNDLNEFAESEGFESFDDWAEQIDIRFRPFLIKLDYNIIYNLIWTGILTVLNLTLKWFCWYYLIKAIMLHDLNHPNSSVNRKINTVVSSTIRFLAENRNAVIGRVVPQ